MRVGCLCLYNILKINNKKVLGECNSMAKAITFENDTQFEVKK